MGTFISLSIFSVVAFADSRIFCGPSEKSGALSTAVDLCEAVVNSPECQYLAHLKPELTEDFKKCSPVEIAKEAEASAKNKLSGCLSGGGEALLDTFWELPKESVETLNDYGGALGIALYDLHAELREMDKDVNKKRKMMAQHPKYSQLSDEQLSKYSAAFLRVEKINFEAVSAQIARGQQRSKSLSELAEQSEREFQAREFDRDRKGKSVLSSETIGEAVGEWLVLQGVKYYCFNSQAQYEMGCYALASLVEPATAVALLAKSKRLKRILGGSEPSRSKLPVDKKVDRDAVKTHLLRAQYTTEKENREWIALAEASPKNARFFEVENSKLKQLNDSIKDKDLVTSLSNMQKQLLQEEVNKVIAKYPKLKFHPYSDFKNMRFAVVGDIPKSLQRDMAAAFISSEKKFVDWVKRNELVRVEDEPESWFKMGTGETADSATIAARFSRAHSAKWHDLNDSTVRGALIQELGNVEKLRAELAKQMRGTSTIEKTSNGAEIFKQEVFEIVRKSNSSLEIEKKLKDKFGLASLPPELAENLEAYVKKVDLFSPSLRLATRDVASLESAQQGGLSIDFVGLGAANLQGTAASIAGKGDLSQALQSARKTEKEISSSIDRQRDSVRNIGKNLLGKSPFDIVCSGDDCVGIPQKVLTQQEKQKFVNALAQAKEVSNVRVAFIGDGVRNPAHRSELATHGESLEKKLRSRLDSRMEPSKLRGLLFAVDMKTKELGTGKVDLLIGASPTLKLSPVDWNAIRSVFKDVTEEFNREIKTQGMKGYLP